MIKHIKFLIICCVGLVGVSACSTTATSALKLDSKGNPTQESQILMAASTVAEVKASQCEQYYALKPRTQPVLSAYKSHALSIYGEKQYARVISDHKRHFSSKRNCEKAFFQDMKNREQGRLFNPFLIALPEAARHYSKHKDQYFRKRR